MGVRLLARAPAAGSLDRRKERRDVSELVAISVVLDDDEVPVPGLRVLGVTADLDSARAGVGAQYQEGPEREERVVNVRASSLYHVSAVRLDRAPLAPPTSGMASTITTQRAGQVLSSRGPEQVAKSLRPLPPPGGLQTPYCAPQRCPPRRAYISPTPPPKNKRKKSIT